MSQKMFPFSQEQLTSFGLEAFMKQVAEPNARTRQELGRQLHSGAKRLRCPSKNPVLRHRTNFLMQLTGSRPVWASRRADH